MAGQYVVARRLGSGGMGEVYLAHSLAGDPVAVKVIRTDKLDPETRARFEKEAQIARTIVGTSRVARFLAADPFADRPWLAMEFVPGHTLHDQVAEHGVLMVSLVASLGALLAEGLQAVHDVGLVHRDLKPQNVIMGRYGPVVIDFGLGAFVDASKDSLSSSGMVIGTARCMSPEQASGHPHVTPAADVYGLGVLLLYAATGHYPYDGTGWQAIVAQVASADHQPDLTGLPAGLSTLVPAMLAHEQHRRPTLRQVMKDCAEILTRAGVTAVDARHDLIAASFLASPAQGEEPSPRAEAVLAELAERAAGNTNPLDRPPPIAQESVEEPPTEVPSRRTPASRRVAEGLRRAYSRQIRLF